MSVTSQNNLGGTVMTNILLEKRAHLAAKEDALRLYNRVRQLQKEEDKAQKRIQDTKKKAKEIIKLRERNELLRQEKEARMAQLALEIEQQKQENLRLKEDIVRNKTEQENRIWADKVTTVQQTKEEKAECEKLLAESRLLSRKEALEQKEAVRRQQEEARRRIEQLKFNKLQMAQEEYERRLREEMDAKAAKEAEIERLAMMEMQLIDRLKSKQREQRQAYQQLEAVLSLGASSGSSRVSSKPQSPRMSSPAPPGPNTSTWTGQQQQSQGSQQGDASPPPQEEPTEEDVARAFSVYDDEAMGEIPSSALEALMGDLGVPLNAAQLSQALAQLDPDSTGRISFGEFLLWWKG